MSNLQYESGAIKAADCYGNSWSLVTNKFGLYLGVGIVTMLMVGCIPLVSLFLVGPIMGGFYFLALKDMRGEPVDFGMMFKGFDKFVPLMVIGLIQSIPGVIFQIIRFSMNIGEILSTGGAGRNINFFQSDIPNFGLAEGISIVMVFVGLAFALISIVWTIALQFAIPIALENDIGPIDAIKLSVNAALANLGGMILMLLLGIVAAILGMLAICLGLFVAIPVIWVANAFAYRQVFPLIDRQFNMSPPPPNAYGSNFGSGMQ